jgi:hypothetical protein
LPVHKCSCRETYVDSTEYCTCIARSSWTACHLILHDHQQIRKWTSWCLSSYLQNISCAVHGLTISLAWSETMEGNGYFSIWWASDSTHCLTLNWIPILKSDCQSLGAAPTERPNQKSSKKLSKRSKNFSGQEDALLVSAWLNQCQYGSCQRTNQTRSNYWERIWLLPFQQGFLLNLQPKFSDASLGNNVRECQLVSWM